MIKELYCYNIYLKKIYLTEKLIKYKYLKKLILNSNYNINKIEIKNFFLYILKKKIKSIKILKKNTYIKFIILFK